MQTDAKKKKPAKIITQLSRLMANVGGPLQRPLRTLVMVFSHSSEVRAETLKSAEQKCCSQCKEHQHYGSHQHTARYEETQIVDDAEHTFFGCCHWADERMRIESTMGEITPENIVGKMMSTEESWNMIAGFAECILRKKKRDLNERQKNHMTPGGRANTG
ncbi:hypothetical protein EVAR_73993_1, partial [Eumeta japonica]